MMKKEKLLLEHCTLTNRELQKNLVKLLTSYNVSFVKLIENLNISVSLPIKLSGTLTNLIVSDNCNNIFLLRLFRNRVVSEISYEHYDIYSVYNVNDFSIHLIQKSWIYGLTTFYVNFDIPMISCKSYWGNTLLIFFDEDVNLNGFLDELEKLCTSFLDDSFNLKNFDVDKIKVSLASILSCNSSSVIIETFSVSK